MTWHFTWVTLPYEPLSKTLKSSSCVSEQYKQYQYYDQSS